MNFLPNLYPLRFLLAVFVIIFHLPRMSETLKIPFFYDHPVFNKGPLAVYYFLTLSGFLILRPIYRELSQQNSFDFKRFYLRRIQRLYPVYYLILLVGISIYHVILPALHIPFEVNYSVASLIAHFVFFVPNVFIHDHPEVGGILLITWSIGVEEQFYLVIPAIMYLFRKNLVASLTILLLLLLAILFAFPQIYVNLFFYFLGGGILAVVTSREPVKLFGQKWLHVLVYALFICSFSTNLFEFSNGFVFHTINLVISSLFISFIADYPVFIIKSRVLGYLGKISYGLYMYHMIVLTGLLFVVSKLRPVDHLDHTLFIILLNLAVISMSVAVASLSYRYLESRFYKPVKILR